MVSCFQRLLLNSLSFLFLCLYMCISNYSNFLRSHELWDSKIWLYIHENQFDVKNIKKLNPHTCWLRIYCMIFIPFNKFQYKELDWILCSPLWNLKSGCFFLNILIASFLFTLFLVGQVTWIWLHRNLMEILNCLLTTVSPPIFIMTAEMS